MKSTIYNLPIFWGPEDKRVPIGYARVTPKGLVEDINFIDPTAQKLASSKATYRIVFEVHQNRVYAHILAPRNLEPVIEAISNSLDAAA